MGEARRYNDFLNLKRQESSAIRRDVWALQEVAERSCTGSPTRWRSVEVSPANIAEVMVALPGKYSILQTGAWISIRVDRPFTAAEVQVFEPAYSNDRQNKATIIKLNAYINCLKPENKRKITCLSI
jgi:hypothetical protein